MSLVAHYSVFGQSSTSRIATPIPPQSNIERYGIDYEVKNYVFQNGDSTILNSIDLNYLEQFRLENSDAEVVDQTTGLVILLYYESRKKPLKHPY